MYVVSFWCFLKLLPSPKNIFTTFKLFWSKTKKNSWKFVTKCCQKKDRKVNQSQCNVQKTRETKAWDFFVKRNISLQCHSDFYAYPSSLVIVHAINLHTTFDGPHYLINRRRNSSERPHEFFHRVTKSLMKPSCFSFYLHFDPLFHFSS